MKKKAEDRITELPGPAIDSILQNLPLQDAVRTSALSRQWRYKWREMPTVVLDEIFHNHLKNKSLHQHDFVRIVYDVLLNHNVHIKKFELYITDQGCPPEEAVGSWIRSLSENEVQILLLVNDYQVFYKLPSHFYSSVNLVNLYLCGFQFKPPSTFQGFPNLKYLDFESNIFEEEPFRRFITSCPLLESITLFCHDSPKHIVISCSESLKYICLEGALKSVLIDAQGLETLYFLPDSPMIISSQAEVNRTITAFGKLHRVKSLGFGGHTLKFLAAGGPRRKYPTVPMYSLTNVEFHLLNFEDHDQISVAVSIIQSAPYLRYLKIIAYWRASYAVELVQVSLGDDITLGCLKTVEFSEIRGIKPELDLVKSILACSPSLEKMIVKAKPIADADCCKIPAELMRFSRVSPKAEIHYSKSS